MSWARIAAVIENGPDREVLKAELLGLDGAGRKEVATRVEQYVRSLNDPDLVLPGFPPETRFSPSQPRMAGVLMVAVGVLPTAAKVEGFVRKRVVRDWLRPFPSVPFVEVAVARNPDWLGDLGVRLAARVTPYDDIMLYDVAAALTLAGGVDLPLTAGTMFGWAYRTLAPLWPGPGGPATIDDVAAAAAADPLLPTMARAMFELDDATDAFGCGVVVDMVSTPMLPALFARLAARGTLERAELIAGAVDRLVRGGKDSELRPYTMLLDLLSPTAIEWSRSTEDLLLLVENAGAPVAGTAFAALLLLDDNGLLALETLCAACTAVLGRKEKGTAKKAVDRLSTVLTRDPTEVEAVLVTATAGFTHPRVDIAEQALDLVAAHLDAVVDPLVVAEVHLAADNLDPALRGRATERLGSSAEQEDPTASVPSQVVESPPWPTPLDAQDVAAFFAGRPLRSEGAPSRERLMEAVVRLRHDDRAGLYAALAGEPDHSDTFATREWVVLWMLRKRADGSSETHERWEKLRSAPAGGLPTGDPWVLRMIEIIDNLLESPVPQLVSTPTQLSGSLTAEVLVQRLTRAATQGWTPWPVDLEQALLRVEIDAEAETWATRAAALGTVAGDRLATWLRTGGLPDPLVTTKVLTPRAKPSSWRKPEVRRRLTAEIRPSREPGGPLESLLTRRSQPSDDVVDHVDSPSWLTSLPLPHHVDVLAAWMLPDLANDAAYAPVSVLLGADGPTGPAFGAALCFLLTHQKETVRVRGLDLLLAADARGAAWPTPFATALAELGADNSVLVGRAVTPLADAAAAGAAPRVLAALALVLPPLFGTATRALPELLALTSRLVAGSGVKDLGADLLTALQAHRGGSTRTAKETRRLLDLIGS